MKRRFTAEAKKALNKGAKYAAGMGCPVMSTEHLLYGLASVPGLASRVLRENGCTKEWIEFQLLLSAGALEGQEPDEINKLSEALKRKDKDKYKKLWNEKFQKKIYKKITPVPVSGICSPKLTEILEQSAETAERADSEETGTQHLLLEILKATGCVAYKILLEAGAGIQKMYMDIVTTTGGDIVAAKNELIASRTRGKKGTSGTPILDQYARDLNQLAAEGRIDPVLNREDEIGSVIEILSRRTKNNPCLTGEPGVGKTAIAEGLATRIVEGSVPDALADKRVLTLDLSGMVAGSKYRGEFEERIKKAIREAKQAGNILLFIDELHTVIGAGGAEGALDASNILKPALARGEIQVIGATTREEYRKHIEKDAALERRFQPVLIEEPTPAQTVSMLKGLRSRYEEYHQVTISDEALDAAVRLSVRYINDRFLPDKAIDLIDEAAARFHLQKVYKKSGNILPLKEQLEDLYEQREQALIRNDRESLPALKEAIQKMEEKLSKEQKKRERKERKEDNTITAEHIAEVTAKWTHIPVQKLAEEEMTRLRKLEQILHERVVGQEEAVEAVARAVRRGRVGLKDPKRPIGSFLFLGPTGVGKTELTKALAEAVFGSEKDMIRVDMSEYMEKQSVSKIIGSPPGYVGYEEGGQLSEKVRRKPYSVILFDEIEKAHPDVFNMLLQVLEDGHITDAHGRRVDFKNTIIIMTSNAGANRIISPKTLGFGQTMSQEEEHKKMKAGVMEEVKHIFKPEFINRLDEMIVFHVLNEDNIHDIAGMMIRAFATRVREQMDITLTVSEAVVSHIAKKGFDKDYGARPLRRAMQTELEDLLAENILAGTIGMGDTVEADLKKENEKDVVFVQKFTKKR